MGGEVVETIYFGGGTPSLLETGEVRAILLRLRELFPVDPAAEITLEANPDDFSADQVAGWREAGINRLSIGIQSFFDEDLRWMNRAHGAQQARESIRLARSVFDNITADLIYGLPGLSNARWQQNVEELMQSGIPHLSCYALTVEEKTPLLKRIRTGKAEPVNPDSQSEQFLLLMHWLEQAGFEHYEISNFAKPGFRSRHNTSYWQGKRYLGLGPSAHSYDLSGRQWNIANNQRYIEALNAGIIPFERELLTPVQQINEYIMTSLRTLEGINLDQVGDLFRESLLKKSQIYQSRGVLIAAEGCLRLTKEGKLLADGIAADLFFD